MPTLNKMNSDEIEALKKKKSGLSERAKTRQEYIEKLNKFQPGDWISVDLNEGDKRQTVRNRLKTAAKELGYHLNFMRTRNNLIFEIQNSTE